jgi:hypothetical protein
MRGYWKIGIVEDWNTETDGMMEYWNVGILGKTRKALQLSILPMVPFFHHSNFSSFRSIITADRKIQTF